MTGSVITDPVIKNGIPPIGMIPAPAKINLFLRITHIRGDGMHELDTAFAYTDLCDWLHLEPCSSLEVTCSQAHLSGQHNLVYKILAAFKTEFAVVPGLKLHIEKHIPEQAGLGGGSSDAASALLAANHCWGVNADVDTLIRFATPFGADIPCFLYGRASRACGIGEQMQEYGQALPGQTLLLAKPHSGLSTAAVFQHFDRLFMAQADSTLTEPKGLDTIRRDSPALAENSLEASACYLNPDVSTLLACLRQYTDMAWMSGSGSACVALLDDPKQAVQVAAKLKARHLAAWTHIGKISGTHPLNNIIGT